MSARLLLKKGRVQPLLGRHPWVYAGSVARTEGDPAPGDEVDLCGPDGRFIARGLLSPGTLRARAYSWRKGVAFDRALLEERLRKAIAYRRDVLGLPSEETTGFRLVHSEGDRLPGLIVDRFGEVLVIQLSTAAMDRRRELILDVLEAELSPLAIVETSDSHRELEGLEPASGLRRGVLPSELIVRERGLALSVPAAGQKTGLFFDQRENRARIESLAGGRRVLDAFCYRGGFALAAARGGAAEVLAIDSSGPAIAAAEADAAANGLTINAQKIDCFKRLGAARKAGEQWDLVILDPPRYANRKDQLKQARQKYRELFGLGLAAVAPGGVLLACSCSGRVSADDFEAILRDAAIRARRELRIVQRGEQAPDHPVSPTCPESRYLKAVFCQVD